MLEPVPSGLVWLGPNGLGVDQVESRVRLKYNTVPEVERWTWRVLCESCQARLCYKYLRQKEALEPHL